MPGETVIVDRPDILIIEGLNVLQTSRLPKDGKAVPFVSDFFDFSIYIDADEPVIRSLVPGALPAAPPDRLPRSRFLLPPLRLDQRRRRRPTFAEGLWERINLVNLHENILPTRPRADLILRKGANHRVEQVALTPDLSRKTVAAALLLLDFRAPKPDIGPGILLFMT